MEVGKILKEHQERDAIAKTPVDRLVDAIMARRQAASGVPVFVDPVILRLLIEKEFPPCKS